jgi:hypothetical protein
MMMVPEVLSASVCPTRDGSLWTTPSFELINGEEYDARVH